MQPTRFEIDGVRYYRTGDRPDKFYPSVTAILSRTASEKSKKALLSWNEKNPGGLKAAGERGSAVHAACERYVRGLPTEIPDQYRPYWDGLAKHLDRYDHFIWSEKPLDPRWKICTAEDGISRVWSHTYGYTGCPDLIGVRNGITILSDFKTSVSPYCRHWPSRLPTELRGDRFAFSGAMKYHKCARQLAAYALAVQETIGVTIDSAQILVSTPELDQCFMIHGDELCRHTHQWLVKVREFRELTTDHQDQLPVAA